MSGGSTYFDPMLSIEQVENIDERLIAFMNKLRAKTGGTLEEEDLYLLCDLRSALRCLSEKLGKFKNKD